VKGGQLTWPPSISRKRQNNLSSHTWQQPTQKQKGEGKNKLRLWKHEVGLDYEEVGNDEVVVGTNGPKMEIIPWLPAHHLNPNDHKRK